MRRVFVSSSLIVLAIALGGCHDTGTQPSLPPNVPTNFHCELAISCKIPAHVTVLPMNADLVPGDTVRLTAYVDADSGVNTSVDWMPVPTSFAQVDKAGLVRALAVGSDTVVATMRADPIKQGVGIVRVIATPQPWAAVAALAQSGTKTQAMLAILHDSVDVTMVARPAGETMAALALVITGPVDTVFSAPVVQSANEDVAFRWHTEAVNGAKPVFPTGVYYLSARLTLANGAVIAAPQLHVTVNNP